MAISQVSRVDLSTISVDIEDVSYLSSYFNITEFNPTLGSGKNLLIINTTLLLSTNPDNIQIQCVDSLGNYLLIDSAILYNSVTKKQQYYYALNVDDTFISGPGKLTVVGITIDNKKIRWTANVVINTAIETTSKIVFFDNPQLKVFPLITYVLENNTVNYTNISGSVTSLAITPPKDFDITNDYNKNKLDYRIIDNSASFSNGLLNFPINLNINAIKSFGSNTAQNINDNKSILIQNVLNKTTLQLSNPYVYQNDKISEIISASYTCSFNDIVYNSASFFTSSYLTQSTDFSTGSRYVKNSYVLIGYSNIDTFSGKVQRHKIYRKSLSTAGDFELVTDSLFDKYELLADITTPNRTFENLGTFFSQFHIDNFWFTSSNAFNLINDSSTFLNAMIISASAPISGGYAIAKVNSSWDNRNSTYIPFDGNQVLNFSGSSYDSNYLHFYPNTSYSLEFNAAFLNKAYNNVASLDFYITSSVPAAANESSYVNGLGIKIGSLVLSEGYTNYLYDSVQNFEFTLSNEIYGALVIYPNNFSSALISNLSITPTQNYGFSQGSYFVKIPFNVNTPNEAFEIKAELYDKDGVLAYNNFYTVQYFDPFGLTTPINIKDFGTTIVANYISSSYLIINGTSVLNGPVYANYIYGTASLATDVINPPFLRNTTNNGVNTIKQYYSIFNPSYLLIQSSSIFIVENNSDYYVLGDVINSGSLEVSGTMKIDGALIGDGPIFLTGIIE
jgi:hypothetical protein